MRHRDPDETEGRRLYRERADAEARRSLAMARHKVRLLPLSGELVQTVANPPGI